MSSIEALLEAVKEDKTLRDKLLGAKSVEEAVSVANSQGFTFTTADWLAHQARQTLELSDDELENIAGGASNANCNSLSACGDWESC